VTQVAAVFDIDGTLVTFKFDVQGTRKALLQELVGGGFDTAGLSLTTPTQLIVDSARMQVESGAVRADFEALRSRLYSILDAFEGESGPTTIVFPGVRATLDRLRSRGVRTAVLTNSGRKAALDVLARAGIVDCFEFVLTRDDVPAMKPSAEGLKKAVSLLGLPADRVYYVGDSLYDVAAAKLAGLKVVSVATGNYTADRLRADGADFVVSSVCDLPRLLGI